MILLNCHLLKGQPTTKTRVELLTQTLDFAFPIMKDTIIDDKFGNYLPSTTSKLYLLDSTHIIFDRRYFFIKKAIYPILKEKQLNIDSLVIEEQLQLQKRIYIDFKLINDNIETKSRHILNKEKVKNYYMLSSPFFLFNNKYAIVELFMYCIPFCRMSKAYVYECVDGKWVLLYTTVITSS
jgi:hypothetical protein